MRITEVQKSLVLAVLSSLGGCGVAVVDDAEVDVPCGARHDGNFVVETPEHLEALVGVSEIGGSLTISRLNAQNLEQLSCLSHLQGDLSIRQNTFLPALIGLESLRDIGGNVEVIDNPTLRRLAVLSPALIGGSVLIKRNSRLWSLEGFEQLERVSSIEIVGNPGLRQIDAFEHTFTSNVHIEDNSALETIRGFANVSDSVEIARNQSLQSVDAFAETTALHRVALLRNGALEELAGFDDTRKVGELQIVGSPILSELAAFSNLVVAEVLELATTSIGSGSTLGALEEVRELSIRQSHATLLPRFPKLHSVDDVLLSGNAQLSDLSGLMALGAANEIIIEDNDFLQTIDALHRVSVVDGNVRVTYNPSLSACEVADWHGHLVSAGFQHRFWSFGNNDDCMK